jgi:hypothetical protein
MFLLAHAEPGDPPQRFQLHDSVTQCPPDGPDEHVAGHLAAQGEQLPRQPVRLDARSLQGVIQIRLDFGPHRPQALFLLPRVAWAVLSPRLWLWLARRGETLVLHAIGRQGILDQAGSLLKDLQVVRVSQHFDVFPPFAGHPVVIAVERDVAILIRAPWANSSMSRMRWPS